MSSASDSDSGSDSGPPDTPPRTWPNIIITGTPGTGKTTHCTQLADISSDRLRHMNIGELVKEEDLHNGWDEQWRCWKVDDDKLLDHLIPILETSSSIAHDSPNPLDSHTGNIIDWHSCSIFPLRLIDLVVVLRCDHTKLWERLEERNYPLHKIQENNTSEIMEVCLAEAIESYPKEIVIQLSSESVEDVEHNGARIWEWVGQWRRDNGWE